MSWRTRPGSRRASRGRTTGSRRPSVRPTGPRPPWRSLRLRGSGRFLAVAKPSGTLHPRVQKAGPEHFGIVAVDCAKARSKWMLADFYGRILVPPAEVEHHKPGFDAAIAQIRQAITQHDLRDVL